LATYTCNTGYTKAMITGDKYGCVSCKGLVASRILTEGRNLAAAAGDNITPTGY